MIQYTTYSIKVKYLYNYNTVEKVQTLMIKELYW